MNKDYSEEFDLFYLELPQADYLNDLGDIEIQDAYDDKDQTPVLRKEDVNKLRDDILGQADRMSNSGDATNGSLFAEEPESQ
jgi:hypothetical protein